jgi:hypothetical protein
MLAPSQADYNSVLKSGAWSDYKPSKSAHDSYKSCREERERREKAEADAQARYKYDKYRAGRERNDAPTTARLEGRDGFVRYEANEPGEYARQVITAQFQPSYAFPSKKECADAVKTSTRTFYYSHDVFDGSRNETVAVYREV